MSLLATEPHDHHGAVTAPSLYANPATTWTSRFGVKPLIRSINIENRTYIDILPDGTQRVRSDLIDDAAANQELAVFFSQVQAMPITGGNDGGTGQSHLSVTDVIDKFFEQMTLGGHWKNPKTLSVRKYRMSEVAKELGPDQIFRNLTRADGRRFRDTLLTRVSPQNEQSPSEQLRNSTAKSYFQLFKKLARFAVVEELHSIDISEQIELKFAKQKTRSYRAFEDEDVVKILNSGIYTNAESKRAKDYHSAYFWLPLLGLHTGARLNELCQLRIEDVKCLDGIWYIEIQEGDEEINEEKGRSTKNEPSERSTPIHSALLKAGFLAFVEARKHSTIDPGQLFEGMTWDKNNKWGKKVGRWHADNFLPELELEDTLRKCFHSYRHTVTQFLRDVRGIKDIKIADIIGHEGKSTTSKYGRNINARTLRAIQKKIEKIDYGVPMDHIHFDNYLEYQACRGRPEKNAHLLAAYRRKQAKLTASA